MDTINQPVQSKAGKLLRSNMALKRCKTYYYYYYYKVCNVHKFKQA